METRLAAVEANHALELGPFVSVNPNPETGVTGPNITFSGANIHIVSGSGMTDDDGNPRGLGNLIIGYDEDPALFGRSREGRFDYLPVQSTGISEPLPAAEPRLGRRTVLTFPLLPPPQKN